jgi:hypothetical protein
VAPPVQFLAAIALPVAAIYSLIGGGRLVKWIAEQQSRPLAPEPVERVHANLVRLRADLEAMETRTDLPAKNLRLRALKAAYVDTLNDACRRLDISPPASAVGGRAEEVPQSDIYRMEATLRQRGLDVRETVVR